MARTKKKIKNVDELMKDTITGITVRGFKSFAKEQSIALRPLTILAGANSSGKSTIIQPLLLLKQTFESRFDPGDLLINGPNIKFDHADQIFTNIHGASPAKELNFRIEIWGGTRLDFPFKLVDISRKQKKIIQEPLSYSTGQRRVVSSVDASERHEKNSDMMASYLEMTLTTKKREWMSLEHFSAFNHIKRILKKLIHLPGHRGNPERTYPVTAAKEEFFGTFQEYIASIIASWQRDKSKQRVSLNSMLRELGLSWKVEAQYVDDTRLALLVGRMYKPKQGGARDLVNIADVGYGVSQVMPVLVALLTAQPGQIVYIEEPEIHLHPNAQYIMARILSGAAKRGVIVIAETHSTFLLRGIQTLVVNGEVPADYVKLHWFTRNPKDGTTTISSADLDDKAAWGDWPEDFDEVSFRVEKELLDARDRKRKFA